MSEAKSASKTVQAKAAQTFRAEKRKEGRKRYFQTKEQRAQSENFVPTMKNGARWRRRIPSCCCSC